MTPAGDHPSVLERWTARASVLAVTVAILVSGIRGAVEGWYPIGDNALLTLRSRDVLTSQHPWLGTWTSASLTVGSPINNPGPLQFDLLAPFAKIDPAAGVAIGVAVLNALAVLLAAAFARRMGGARMVAFTMVAAGGLAWSMGSELLFDPWQPHSLLLPFLALLVLSIALAGGDVVALPWGVGVTSFLVQTHLSYAVLAPGVLGAGLVCCSFLLRRERRATTDGAGARNETRLRSALLVSIVVALACWAQPLWEQVARDGNLVAVASSAGDGDVVVGPRSGVRVAGSVLGDPSGWLRSSFEETFRHDYSGEQLTPVGPPNERVRPLGHAAASLVGVAVLLGISAWRARRNDRREGPAIAVVLGVAVALAVITCVTLPASAVLGVAAHQLRWLWPIAIASAVLPWHSIAPRREWVTCGVAALAIVAGLATLAPFNAGAGPSGDAASIPAVRAFLDTLDGIPEGEVVYFDNETVPFAEPFSGPLLLELQRRGIPFEVDEDPLSYQVGRERSGPDRATSQIFLLVGDASADAPPGGRVIGRVEGVEADERTRADELAEQLRPAVRAGGIRLNEEGEAARRAGALSEAEGPGWESDPELLLDRAVLARLVDQGWVEPGSLPDGAEEWGRIEQRSRRFSVAVVLVPLG